MPRLTCQVRAQAQALVLPSSEQGLSLGTATSQANLPLPSCHSSTLFKPGLLMIAGKPLLLSPETPSCSKTKV